MTLPVTVDNLNSPESMWKSLINMTYSGSKCPWTSEKRGERTLTDSTSQLFPFSDQEPHEDEPGKTSTWRKCRTAVRNIIRCLWEVENEGKWSINGTPTPREPRYKPWGCICSDEILHLAIWALLLRLIHTLDLLDTPTLPLSTLSHISWPPN